MRTDWAGLMRAAAALGVGPESFWRLTPGELVALLPESAAAARPMGRAALDALLARFPDPAPPEHGSTDDDE